MPAPARAIRFLAGIGLLIAAGYCVLIAMRTLGSGTVDVHSDDGQVTHLQGAAAYSFGMGQAALVIVLLALAASATIPAWSGRDRHPWVPWFMLTVVVAIGFVVVLCTIPWLLGSR